MPVRAEPVAPQAVDLSVPIVGTWLGDDGALLRARPVLGSRRRRDHGARCRHLPPGALAALRDAPEDLPIVLTVRPERGHALRETYGFEGSERDVLATGALPAARLAPPAARMLLIAGLAAGLSRERLAVSVCRRVRPVSTSPSVVSGARAGPIPPLIIAIERSARPPAGAFAMTSPTAAGRHPRRPVAA